METMLTFEIEADELELFLQDVNEHLAVIEAGILRLEDGELHECCRRVKEGARPWSDSPR